jgi:hypothetical protein
VSRRRDIRECDAAISTGEEPRRKIEECDGVSVCGIPGFGVTGELRFGREGTRAVPDGRSPGNTAMSSHRAVAHETRPEQCRRWKAVRELADD